MRRSRVLPVLGVAGALMMLVLGATRACVSRMPTPGGAGFGLGGAVDEHSLPAQVDVTERLDRDPVSRVADPGVGFLRTRDGLPVAGCPYSTDGRGMAGGEWPVTSSEGAWSMPSAGRHDGFRVVFRVHANVEIEYSVMPAQSLTPRILELPPLARNTVALQCAEDIVWDVDLGLARYGRSVPEDVWDVSDAEDVYDGPDGRVKIRTGVVGMMRLSKSDIVEYHSAPGRDVVVRAFSVTHELVPDTVRVAVPANILLNGSRRKNGIMVEYKGVDSEVRREEPGIVYWRAGPSLAWRRQPMYGGLALLDVIREADAKAIEIEFRSPAGELFRFEGPLELARSTGVVFRSGGGDLPIDIPVTAEIGISAVLCANGNSEPFELAPASFDAACAWQYRLVGNRLLVNVSRGVGASLWVVMRDGSICRACERDRWAPTWVGGRAAVLPVPSHAVEEIAEDEALVATILVLLEGAGVEGRWVVVGRRRFDRSGTGLASWLVRPAEGYDYRVETIRMVRDGDGWRAASTRWTRLDGSESVDPRGGRSAPKRR